MATIFEREDTIVQTGRVFLVFMVAAFVVWALASLSLKILGVAVAAGGLAFLVWFPGKMDHQRKLYTLAMVKIGIILLAAGLALIIFG